MNRHKNFSFDDERVEHASPERGPSYMHMGMRPSPEEKGLVAKNERITHAYNLRPREMDKIKQRRRAFGSPCLDDEQRLKVVDEIHDSDPNEGTSRPPEGHSPTRNPYHISDTAFELARRERVEIATRLRDKWRALNAERQQVEFEYRRLADVAEREDTGLLRPLADGGLSSVGGPKKLLHKLCIFLPQ